MPKGRRKHVPQRTCVGCRQVLPKRSLIRLVRTSEGVQNDPTGKLPGRGAYLHDRRTCWQRGLKGALAHALRTTLTEADRDRLTKFMLALSEDEGSSVPEVGVRSQTHPETETKIHPSTRDG